MKDTGDFDPQDFPSLALVYERLKESAEYQIGWYDALDSKLAMLWSVATAMIGIVVPVVLASGQNSGYFSWAAIAIYGLTTFFAGLAFFPQKFGSYDAPDKLSEALSVSQPRFMLDQIQFISESVTLQGELAKEKANYVMIVAILVVLEVVALVGWVIFAQV
ncbi:MAG TPA: hypothetical protein VI855_10035 [Dehalococcoidia bacterium]|nr:hypothetical protein [Dehalococcoidia bacterium]